MKFYELHEKKFATKLANAMFNLKILARINKINQNLML